MSIISCRYDLQNLGVEIDQDRNRHYTLRWRVVADQLDLGINILMGCIQTDYGDPVPAFGSAYGFNGSTVDSGSYAQKYKCQLDMEDDEATSGTGTGRWYIYVIEVEFDPPRNDNENERERLTKPNPLDWNTEYWIEWVEEQVPVEEAICQTDLPTILRGPTFEGLVPPAGPVVNAAGQQTIDPLTKSEFHPVLCARKNYLYGHVANVLNQLFRDTINLTDFLGDRLGSWRFLIAEAEKEKTHFPFEDTSIGTGAITYVPIVVKLEFKKFRYVNRVGTGTGAEGADTALGWDRVILNNGQLCFKTFDAEPLTYVNDPRTGLPMLFPAVGYTLREDYDLTVINQPTEDDLIEVEAAEPANLDIYGIQITDPEIKGNHIIYSHYQFADYTPDTFPSDSSEIGNIDSPWKELLDQYATLYP